MSLKLAEETKRVNLVLPVAWVERVDAWRGQQPGVPNFSAAVRMLVEQALDGERPRREAKKRKRSS